MSSSTECRKKLIELEKSMTIATNLEQRHQQQSLVSPKKSEKKWIEYLHVQRDELLQKCKHLL